jgi:hypothetical protein
VPCSGTWNLIVDYRDRGDDEASATARALDAFAADWSERTGMMDELTAVFGDPGDIKQERWDRLRGLFARRGLAGSGTHPPAHGRPAGSGPAAARP